LAGKASAYASKSIIRFKKNQGSRRRKHYSIRDKIQTHRLTAYIVFMNITVSAPGKIHLLGEHSVVYGYPALLASVGKRLYVTVKKQTTGSKEQEIIIHAPYGIKLIGQAVNIFKNAYGIKNLPFLEMTIVSDIPVGSGMGSSAALASGVIGALLKSVKNIWNPIRINELAYEVEKIAHGNPSGADNTTVVFGGLLWFRKEFEFLKNIWSLPASQYKIPHFVFIDTGKPSETTKEMVGLVAEKHRKNPSYMRALFYDQELQTKKLLLAFREGNKEEILLAVRQGEKNLEEMGIVGNLVKKLIRDMESIKGAAKVCGAGGVQKGSGMVLCYHNDLTAVQNIVQKYGFKMYQMPLAGQGIRLEKR
jgi:mevalonate kinase